ncbi:hypothetical protein Tco_0857847 [Tanacetum coccineum]|uniref:Retrotransposon gag domain-containing protein n=1 Tax=Tanacetum coccineum TaxID=301880 RepID=A0ABQ5B7K9_9ASTR
MNSSVNAPWEVYNDTSGIKVFTSKGPGHWFSNDIKVDIPEYDGKLDPDEFVEWLRTVECAFDYKETSEEHKVKIVAMKLRKYASTWWANTCTKRERLGKTKASFSQLHHLKQNQRPAEEYSREFEYLLMKYDLPKDDPQTLIEYMKEISGRQLLSHKEGMYEMVVMPFCYSQMQPSTVHAIDESVEAKSFLSEEVEDDRQAPKEPSDTIDPNPPPSLIMLGDTLMSLTFESFEKISKSGIDPLMVHAVEVFAVGEGITVAE